MAIIHVLGSSILLYVLLLIFPTAVSLSQSEALLKLKRSFVNRNGLDSWKIGTEPCALGENWVHVVCTNGVVSGLHLGHLGLSGTIDVDALVSLPGLRSISFVSNAFSGPIPDFYRMDALKVLSLSGNRFTGEIQSDYFTNMAELKKIWLSENRFSGRVPLSLGKLSHLIELHLEDNQFSGAMPPLEQSTLISLNVSNNELEGEIPPDMSRFTPDSFNGNPGLCGRSLGKDCNALRLDKRNRRANDLVFLWTLLAAGVLFLAMVIGIVVLKRKQERSNTIERLPSVHSNTGTKDIRVSGLERFGWSHRSVSSNMGTAKNRKADGDMVMVNNEMGEFGMDDLLKATAEMLGSGMVGGTYKTTMASGLTVVVKRIKEMSKIGRVLFDAEMRRLGSLKHKNVVAMLAYHYQQDEQLLVYKYQPEGNLLSMLHRKGDSQLNWPVRLRIILGIARGLGYLHGELSSKLKLPHGNLKLSNVFLTSAYEAAVSDYGLCSLISSSHAESTLAAYRTPEAILHQQVSPKSDVYCLGVIILEILTGKLTYLDNGEEGMDMVQWVRSCVAEGRQASLFDQQIVCNTSCAGEMEGVLEIGLACIESNPEQRLDLTQAIKRLECVPVEESSHDVITAEVPM